MAIYNNTGQIKQIMEFPVVRGSSLSLIILNETWIPFEPFACV